MRRAVGAVLGLLCLVGAPAGLLAQTKGARSSAHAPPPTTASAVTTLRGRFGIEAAAHLLRSTDADERLRGLQRAAATHTPEALALLQRASGAGLPGAFDPRAPIDGVARTDPRALLAAVRGLSAWADRESARSALASIVSGPTQSFATRVASLPSDDPAADESTGAARILLARQEAAIALADSGGPLAVEALMALARSGGPGQNPALDALALHPPVGPVLGGVTLTTPAAIALATGLGDLRSVDAIEGALRASDPALRAGALAALGAARDTNILAVARASAHDPDTRVRLAAAEALLRLGAPDGPRAVEALIADDAAVRGALRIAQEAQSEGIARAAAARAAASSDAELRSLALVALGRQASALAVSALLQLAADPAIGGDAAYALGRSPSPAAASAIETLAASAPTRRLAVRAYFVRRFARGERTHRLDSLLESLASSPDARDRAVAVEALVALGEKPLALALRDPDPRVRRAAAMGAGAVPDANASLVAAFAVETDETTRRVLALGFADEGAAAGVPTSTLVDRVDAAGADAPLAALALAVRADARQAAVVDGLLASRDPLLRAHVSLGLGGSASHDATGRLAHAYEFEADAEVRRAIVRALARRDPVDGSSAPSRREALEWASKLDPDRIVRHLAARALSGGAPVAEGPTASAEVAWIRLVPAPGAVLPTGQTAAVVGADGLARPIAFDDDGYALVPGISAGEASLRLAPRLPAYESPQP